MRRLGEWLAQDLALSIQCICTSLVALGAAYASHRHGREFALRFGADGVTASIWLLLVDGLLTIATVELWKMHRSGRPSGRWVAWLAFVFGICLSLVANICSAPTLSVLQVMEARTADQSPTSRRTLGAARRRGDADAARSAEDLAAGYAMAPSAAA